MNSSDIPVDSERGFKIIETVLPQDFAGNLDEESPNEFELSPQHQCILAEHQADALPQVGHFTIGSELCLPLPIQKPPAHSVSGQQVSPKANFEVYLKTHGFKQSDNRLSEDFPADKPSILTNTKTQEQKGLGVSTAGETYPNYRAAMSPLYILSQNIRKFLLLLRVYQQSHPLTQRWWEELQWQEQLILMDPNTTEIKGFESIVSDNQIDSAVIEELQEIQRLVLEEGKLQIIMSDLMNYVESLDVANQSGKGPVETNKESDEVEELFFDLVLPTCVYSDVDPAKHRRFIATASSMYDKVAPVRFRTILPNNPTAAPIEMGNFFTNQVQKEKQLLYFPIRETKKLATYSLSSMASSHTLDTQHGSQLTVSSPANFGPQARVILSPNGRLYVVDVESKPGHNDANLYEVVGDKLISRGVIPSYRRLAGMIFCGSNLYSIGGCSEAERASCRGQRYSNKNKKWSSIAKCNVGLVKPTLCLYNDRYIVKIGGLNQFNYISRMVEMYDSQKDNWIQVRITPKQINQQIQILEDALAQQISDRRIFIFGGCNRNNYRIDTSFLIDFPDTDYTTPSGRSSKIIEVESWAAPPNTSRSILTFFGDYQCGYCLIHENSIYTLRTDFVRQ